MKTQEHIAKVCGICQATVSNYILGKTRPTGLARKALQANFPILFEKIEEKWKLKKES